MARTTVLIAPVEAIPTLRQQVFLQESLGLPDTDAEFALERIREYVPGIIAVEREFAASDAGRWLLKEILADSRLTACRIQTVGIRRAQRFPVDDQVLIDGTSARLIDISATGAHVISPTALKPTQELNLALREEGPPLAARAVWVQYELPREGPQYRAGIQFAPSAEPVVAEYLARVTR